VEESERGNNSWIGIITVAALVLMLVLVGGTIYFVYKSS
jgi:hypothetical protein